MDEELTFVSIEQLRKEALEESKVEIEAMVQTLPQGLREQARKDIAGPMPRLKSYKTK